MATQKLELSPSTISRIETAQVGVRPRDVRDSKDREGPVLIFTAHEWEAFLGGLRTASSSSSGCSSRPAPSSSPPLPGAAPDLSRSRFPRGARRLAPLLVDRKVVAIGAQVSYPDLGGP